MKIHRLIYAETIKWRKDWPFLVSILGPISQVIFLLLIVWFSAHRLTQVSTGFNAWYKVNYLTWCILFMPVSVALICGLSWDVEERSRTWNHILIQPFIKHINFFLKIVSHFGLTILAQLIFALALIVAGLVLRVYVPELGMNRIEISTLFRFFSFSIAACWPLITFHGWLSSRGWSVGVNLAFMIGGMWLSFELSQHPYVQMISPWGLSSRVSSIVLRAELPSPGMYFVSGATGIVLLMVGLADFKNRLAHFQE